VVLQENLKAYVQEGVFKVGLSFVFTDFYNSLNVGSIPAWSLLPEQVPPGQVSSRKGTLFPTLRFVNL